MYFEARAMLRAGFAVQVTMRYLRLNNHHRYYMTTAEQKWRANRDKVAFVRAFPGMIAPDEAGGREVREEISIEEMPEVRAIVFHDGAFILKTSGASLEPAELLRALAALRPTLEPLHSDAYRTLDELTNNDRELTRRARMENILGAIRTNIGQIPELYEAIPALLEELKRNGGAMSCDGPAEEGG